MNRRSLLRKTVTMLLLMAIGLLLTVLLSVFVWNIGTPGTSQAAAALVTAVAPQSQYKFIRCDTDEATTVFDMNEQCLRLRVYGCGLVGDALWYDLLGNQTPPCNWNGCMIMMVHYEDGFCMWKDFYFYISGMDREAGQYRVEACDDATPIWPQSCYNTLFTDYFLITFPYQIYLPAVFRNG